MAAAVSIPGTLSVFLATLPTHWSIRIWKTSCKPATPLTPGTLLRNRETRPPSLNHPFGSSGPPCVPMLLTPSIGRDNRSLRTDLPPPAMSHHKEPTCYKCIGPTQELLQRKLLLRRLTSQRRRMNPAMLPQFRAGRNPAPTKEER